MGSADSGAGGPIRTVSAHGEAPGCWVRCRDHRASSISAATAIVGGAAEAGWSLT